MTSTTRCSRFLELKAFIVSVFGVMVVDAVLNSKKRKVFIMEIIYPFVDSLFCFYLSVIFVKERARIVCDMYKTTQPVLQSPE